MRSAFRDARFARGFTLLELTVSMTVLGMVLLLLFSALWFAVRSWDGTERQRDTAHSMALVQGLLAQQLRQARPLYLADSQGQRRLAFIGEEASITYVAPLSRHDNALYINRLVLEHGPGGATLRLHYAPFLPGVDAFIRRGGEIPGASSVALLTQVESLAIRYFGLPEYGGMSSWLPQWHHPRLMPERILIHITTAGVEPRGWPDLLVCPGGGAACLMPPAGGGVFRTTRLGDAAHGS
ncbi:MAG: prepilin-type N-terminal cleavage/methylation domain-containing protein [Haliea sp.]